MSVVPITSPDLKAAEVSFFSALCSDDFAHLGVPDGDLRSSWAHCSEITRGQRLMDSGTSYALLRIKLGRIHYHL